MTLNRTTEYLPSLLKELRRLPKETEWVEFKRNNNNPEEIGEYLSVLSNGAALKGKVNAYLVWGVVLTKLYPKLNFTNCLHRFLKRPINTPVPFFSPTENLGIWERRTVFGLVTFMHV